ncbi:MAG TPA: hypothetical protein VMW16_06140 [Sedimentisphaerales bacterium]|nr:hypothetical protein [Sedimentisphaerales bacterium]
MKHKPKSKFTKWDVLVALGCLIFLLANLGAVGTSGRRRAKEMVCLSNLHQWGLVMKMYTGDSNGLFMADLGYGKNAALGRPELKKYYGNDELLLCPEARKPYQEGARNPFGAWRGNGLADPLGNLPCSYGINSWVLSKPCASGTDTDGGALLWRTPNVRGAACVPMILDCAAYENATPWHMDLPPLWDGHWVADTNLNEMRYVCLNRHNAAVNGVFLDFAARKIGLKELWELRWHRNWNPHNDPPPPWPAWMYNFKTY